MKVEFDHALTMRVQFITSFLAGLICLSGFATAHSIRSDQTAQTSRLESVTIHTPSQVVTSKSEFDITFSIRGQDERLKLRLGPNRHLLARNPQLQYLDPTGNIRWTGPLGGNEDKVFKGGVWVQSPDRSWGRAGWARIYILRDGDTPLFEGAFSVYGQHYDVSIVKDTVDGTGAYAQEDRMVVYHPTESHVRRDTGDSSRCANDRLGSSLLARRAESDNTHISLERRQSNFDPGDLVNNIGSTSGCPRTRRVALVGIATDCSYTSAFDTTENLRRSLINMVNTAAEVFESTFNISLGLQNLTISDANCPSTASAASPWNVGCSGGDMNWRLQQFTSWRSSISDSSNAYWTLMTGCPSGSEVGISWIGQLCNSRSGTNVVARTSNQWQVFAHESGHTFGAVHDCDSSGCGSRSQCCPLSPSTCDADAQYIMNPFSMSSQTEFSPCTVGNVCSLLGSQNESAGMGSSRPAKNATAAIIAMITTAATGQHAGSEMVPYATTQPDLAAITVCSHHLIQYVVRVEEVAICRRPAVAIPALVPLTDTHRMDKHVAIHPVYFVPMENAQTGICNVDSSSAQTAPACRLVITIPARLAVLLTGMARGLVWV
ncbi:ADAM metallopeptidase domain [Aspergillus hancockii]|nr:ADAM metallopeptidase domain [Aspergillus hancockii]